METKNIFVALILLVGFFSANCAGSVINVGPGTSFSPAGSNDQDVINAAIGSANAGDTVQLAPMTFHISSSIVMKSGVSLNGSGIGATVIYCDEPETNFATLNIIDCRDVSDIEISNFLIDGGWESLSVMHAASNRYREYEKGVCLAGCSNVVVHDLKMQYSMGDFIVCKKNTGNVQVYNTVGKPGHDSFDAWSAGDGISVFNNCWGTFINSCIKVHNTKNVQIFKNTFYTDTGSGNAGVEVMGGNVTGLNVSNNIFSTLQLNAVYHDPADGDCSGEGIVSNNLFYNSPAYNGIGGMDIASKGNRVTDSYSSTRGTKDRGYLAGSESGNSPENSPENLHGNLPGNLPENLPVYSGTLAPSVTFPVDGSTISTVNGDVSISWTFLNATRYSVNVYNSTSKLDSSHLIYSLKTSQASANVPVSQDGAYAVKIGAYDDVHKSWVYNSPVSIFTVKGKTSATVYSGVFGYLTDATTGQPIKSAVVTLSNDTWKNTLITDVDGLYQFNVNNEKGAYCLAASVTGYLNSPEFPVNMTGINTELNLKMVQAPDYCEPHYVQLYVSSDSNERIAGCEVQIYAPNNDLKNGKPNFCAWTNKEGKAVFHLTQGVKYKIITITLGGQKYTNTLTPDLDQYVITIPASSKSSESSVSSTSSTPSTSSTSSVPASSTSSISSMPSMKTVISTNCTYKPINETAAYINASYCDSSLQSGNLTFVLGNMSDGITFVPSGISGTNDNVSNPTGVVTDSFIVTNCSGKTYTVKINAQSQKYGTISENVNVTIPKELPDSNGPYAGSNMSYFCVFILLVAGLILSKNRNI